jgi:hypothetical protein
LEYSYLFLEARGLVLHRFKARGLLLHRLKVSFSRASLWIFLEAWVILSRNSS